jgi:hypothetical protein
MRSVSSESLGILEPSFSHPLFLLQEKVIFRDLPGVKVIEAAQFGIYTEKSRIYGIIWGRTHTGINSRTLMFIWFLGIPVRGDTHFYGVIHAILENLCHGPGLYRPADCEYIR